MKQRLHLAVRSWTQQGLACSRRSDGGVRREGRERKKIRRKKGRGREEARSHPYPTPSLIFFCSHIHRINLYAWDSEISFPSTYPLDSDLSGG